MEGMTSPQVGFERRVQTAIEASPSRIPVILGGCGSGRTWLLHRIRERAGRNAAQYIDVERCATTPERFLQAVISSSPFPWHAADRKPATARDAFDALLAYFDSARTPGGEPCTFILDEVLELRTFESFPGLRHVLRDLLEALSGSGNRFVLSTRYTARAHRLLRDTTARFEVMHMPAMASADVSEMLAPLFNGYEQMATGGTLDRWCRFCYELRLHRARGYGALKAILDILAEEEPMTLTEISQRLHRTPGSTKDYLSWLEDVDLVTSRQKRYSFTDPLLRLWVRLHCRPVPPSMEDVAREVQRYAAARLPQAEPVPALAYAGVDASPEERKSWGIIEID